MRALRLDGLVGALVVAPHPDDETIAAYGLIRSLKTRGARVRILVVSDGAASHPASVRWPWARLVAERRRETRRAMRRIGVPDGDIRHLGLPDGQLVYHRASLARALWRAIKALGRGGLVVLPHVSDAHPDHRAVARLAARARSPGTRRIAYLVWPDRNGRAHPPMYGVPLGAARAAKRAAIIGYRTQMGAITDDPRGFSISPAELAAFTRPIELFSEPCP
jgi:LmbE family N-acetylglucosaminyl deacetylase